MKNLLPILIKCIFILNMLISRKYKHVLSTNLPSKILEFWYPIADFDRTGWNPIGAKIWH
jgi:hypothetical protein